MQHALFSTLFTLLKHRWNIVVLAELQRSSGAKFVTLLSRIGLSRGPLTVSLQHLVTIGLVRRNAGYGHPLRPEYILTARGTEIGDHCLSLVTLVRKQGAERIAYRKWSLPLVVAIGQHDVRFNELRAALGGVTPRAQTLALKSLQSAGWVARKVEDGYPPIAIYQLSSTGHLLLNALTRLCEHGS